MVIIGVFIIVVLAAVVLLVVNNIVQCFILGIFPKLVEV